MTPDHNYAPKRYFTGAFFIVLLATSLLAMKGIFAKFSYAAGLNVDTVLLARFTSSVPLFWMTALLLQRLAAPLQADTHPAPAQQKKAMPYGLCALSGFFFYFAARCDFTALSLLDASISRLILFTFPALVLLMNTVLKRTLPTQGQMIAFGMTYGGLVVMLLPTVKSQTFSVLGVVFAMGAAFGYAAFLVVNQRAVARMSALWFTVWTNTFTLFWFALETVLFPPKLNWGASIYESVLWLCLIVVFSTVVPFFLMNEGVKRLGASEASLITLAGPAITVVAAWVFLDERLTFIQLIGCGLIVFGIAVLKNYRPYDVLIKYLRTVFRCN